MLKKAYLWVYASLVILLATIVIFFKFNQIPGNLTWDEVEFARLTVMLGNQGYTPYTEYATGHSTPYFYIMLVFFKIFGLNEISLRLPSALFGVLTSVVLFFVMNVVFKEKTLSIHIPGIKQTFQLNTAFLLTCMFITMRWFFGFARFSFEGTFVLLLELLSLYGMVLFTHNPKKIGWLIWSAFFAGLAFNSYQPGRFFWIIPLFLLCVHTETRKLKNFMIFGVLFALLIAPLSIYLSQHPDIRVKQQLYLQDETRTAIEKVGFFIDNVWRNTKLFFVEGDASGRHNYPFKAALNPILAVFGVIGLIRALRQLKNPMTLTFVLYFGIAMGPTLLTYPHENPNMLRTITVLPSLIYFMGLGIQWLHEWVEKKAQLKVAGMYSGAFLLILVMVSSFTELRTYFVFQRAIFNQAFEVTDRFGGVYFFMKKHHIDINGYRIPEDQIEKFKSVPGPEQIYRNQ